MGVERHDPQVEGKCHMAQTNAAMISASKTPEPVYRTTSDSDVVPGREYETMIPAIVPS